MNKEITIRSMENPSASEAQTTSGKRLRSHDWAFHGVFFLFTWWFLGIRYGDFLYFAQQHDLFLLDHNFFLEHFVYPNGFNEWLTSFMIQFFYLPFWGAIIPAVLLTILVSQTMSLFQFRREQWPIAAIPACLLMNFIVYSGYQICEYGFFRFSFAIIPGLCVALGIGQVGGRRLWADLLLILIAYPLFGSFALIGGIFACFRSILTKEKGPFFGMDFWIRVITFFATPFLYYWTCFSRQIPIHRIFSIGIEEDGSPITELLGYTEITAIDRNRLSLIFLTYLLIMIWVVAIRILRYRTKKTHPIHLNQDSGATDISKELSAKNSSLSITFPFLLFLLLGWATVHFAVTDSTWLDTLAMGRAMENDQWYEIPAIESRAQTVSFPMIAIRNLALFELGESENFFFTYPQTTTHHIIGKLYSTPILFRYGLVNHSVRSAMNSVMTCEGVTVGALKHFALCAMIQGDRTLAYRYLHTLQRTLFYRQLATDYLAILDHKNVSNELVSQLQLIRHRIPASDKLNQGNQAQAVLWLRMLDQPYDVNDALEIQSLQLIYRLMNKEIAEFSIRLPMVMSQRGDSIMPQHFQEALLFRLLQSPELIEVDERTFSREILAQWSRCKPAFLAHLERPNRSKLLTFLRDNFPNTYWRWLVEAQVWPFDATIK